MLLDKIGARENKIALSKFLIIIIITDLSFQSNIKFIRGYMCSTILGIHNSVPEHISSARPGSVHS